MKKTKYYFDSDDTESCYPLDYFIEKTDPSETEITLYEAIPDKNHGVFWCKEYGEIGENGICGKQCKGYNPRNGKSGMCKARSNTLYYHGDPVTIKL